MKYIRLFVLLVYCLPFYCGYGQTNDDAFVQYANETMKLTTWGLATNNIEFGARLCAVGPSGVDNFRVATSLRATSSTNIYGLWKLAPGHRLEMVLKADNGEVIQKTSRGNALCKAPPRNVRSGGTVVVLDPKYPETYDNLFNLRECFEIKHAGSYILEVKPRLYEMNGYKEFIKLDIPEVHIKVVFGESDLKY